MKTYDLVGIGNAVVDVISQADDSFLDHMGIEKGIMQLIERDRAEVLYAAMTTRVQTPGGSVANTIAGAGALGLETAFIGRVNDDALGRFYADAMNDNGIDFVNPIARIGGDRGVVDGDVALVVLVDGVTSSGDGDVDPVDRDAARPVVSNRIGVAG